MYAKSYIILFNFDFGCLLVFVNVFKRISRHISLYDILNTMLLLSIAVFITRDTVIHFLRRNEHSYLIAEFKNIKLY